MGVVLDAVPKSAHLISIFTATPVATGDSADD
jgi:hypothetical protein